MTFTSVWENRNEKSLFLCEGIRCQILINRDINNSNKSSPRFVKRMISNSKSEFESNIVSLMSMIKEPTERIYSSVNNRNFKKSLRVFKQKQLDNEFMSDEQNFDFHKNIYNNWFSSLCSPESRDSRLFLIDLDTENDSQQCHEKLSHLTDVKFMYKTKKGWHFVTDPFNHQLFLFDSCEIKKDGMVLVFY